MKKIVTTSKRIGPKEAADMLKLNTSNRPLSKGHAEALAQSMLRGEWKPTGNTIKFSTENKLIDGQHRLTAIVMSGCTVEETVAYNVPPEAFHVLDTNAKTRNAADVLAITGEDHSATISAALRIVGNWENDPDLTKRSLRFSVPQIEALLKRHPGLRDHANPSVRLRTTLGASYACAFGYLFSLVDPKASQHFMERLATGVGLEQGNPILQLRDMLISNKSARSKLNKKVIAALTIKAFNAYRSKKYPARLRWDSGEGFPIIQGAK